MARQRKDQVLKDAKSYYQLLLYEASGGILGKKPDKEQNVSNATFAEKRGLLDSIIKVAQMEEKANEGEEGPSGLDLIRKGLANGNRAHRGGRDNGGTSDEGSFNNESDTTDIES